MLTTLVGDALFPYIIYIYNPHRPSVYLNTFTSPRSSYSFHSYAFLSIGKQENTFSLRSDAAQAGGVSQAFAAESLIEVAPELAPVGYLTCVSHHVLTSDVDLFYLVGGPTRCPHLAPSKETLSSHP